MQHSWIATVVAVSLFLLSGGMAQAQKVPGFRTVGMKPMGQPGMKTGFNPLMMNPMMKGGFNPGMMKGGFNPAMMNKGGKNGAGCAGKGGMK